ncbi:outer membrane beta-barrel protein [Flavobacterium algicola]|uniref:outer membrane beta-barrel protein n=1 Tax=Flavobacterium algicola TaxID=556529 RepID=UPI001EFE79CA|nr:outer membrane beta-barrel protein [Flavobacterium algicola]MCG9791301.1 outer membrane beta-barrel protein [Flavobacterium algicola]
MFKYHFVILFLLLSLSTFAQESYFVQGQVLDINTQQPLEGANVSFSVVKDSLKLGSTTSDNAGMFKVRLKKYQSPVFMKISYVGHENYQDELSDITENKDLSTIYLFSTENVLKDVVITTAAPPIKVKQDTLEYNAASFKVRPDDNVDAVLKELPGFVIDDDGKITVNGKEVNQILVNGKAFFGKDGAVALQNLPADIINKIQVSDLKTKKEELSGDDAASDFLSVNLTIDDKKNRGYFGKFLAGYGTDDRYEGSFLINQFDKQQRISAVGAVNNINLSGFAIDESFGDDKSKSNGDVGASISRKGITTSNLIGLNYYNEWSDKFESTADYSFNNSVNNNDKKTNLVQFLPTGNITTASFSGAKVENNNHKLNFELTYKPIKTVQIVLEPNIRKSNYKNNSSSSSVSTDEAGALLNENIGTTFRTNEQLNFDNQLTINKSFSKKSRNLIFSLTNNNSKNNQQGLTDNSVTSYTTGITTLRNQMVDNDIKRDYYYGQVEFTEPISDVIRLRVGVEYKSDNTVTDENTFDYNSTTDDYTTVNDAQSSYVSSNLRSIAPKMGFFYNNKVFSFNVKNSTALVQYDNNSLYLGADTNLKTNYIIPEWHTNFKYKFDKSNYAFLKYDYRVNLPTAYQLLPVLDISNAVNTVTGNPDLDPIKKHSFSFNFRNFNIQKRAGFSMYVKADVVDVDIVSARVYAEDGTSVTTYNNIYDVYNTSIGFYWNSYKKIEGNSYRYGAGFNTDYSFDKGFVNNVLYDAKVLSFKPRTYFSFNYGELLTLTPFYTFAYNESKYNNYSIDARSNVVHKMNLRTTNYFGEKWVLSNDFAYSYNANSSAGFSNDYQLWNMSLGYTFLNKTLTARMKVFDILNQNQGFTRTITDTSIRDEENTVLKRYAMFSLIYKIKNFGGVDPPGGESNDSNDRQRRSRDN